MRRLVKAGFALSLAVAVLSLTSVALGSHQAVPDWLTRFGISPCEQNLCVMGIRAGITPWGTASNQLALLPGAVTNNTGDIIFDQPGTKTMFWKDLFGNSTFISVALKPHNDLLHLDALIQYLGEPCSLAITENDVFVEYPQFIAVISPSSRSPLTRLEPQLPISTILLYGQRPTACVQPLFVSTGQNITARWCGFASVRHYVRQCRK